MRDYTRTESKREVIANVARLHQHMDLHRLAAVVARSGQNFTYLSGLAYPGRSRGISTSPSAGLLGRHSTSVGCQVTRSFCKVVNAQYWIQ